MAHSYLLAKKWREAVSLYNRVLSHATSAVTHFQEIDSHPQVCLFFSLPWSFRVLLQGLKVTLLFFLHIRQ